MKLLLSVFSLGLAACSSGPGPVVPETRTERQMIGLLEKFDRWDENGNGELTLHELRHAKALSGQAPSKILKFYDVNENGGISLREAQAGYARADDAEFQTKR